jgi:hypothetical protein
MSAAVRCCSGCSTGIPLLLLLLLLLLSSRA